MELSTITMDKTAARKAFLDYKHALEAQAGRKLGEAQRSYDELDRAVMRGYKMLAAGKQLVELSSTVEAGGLAFKRYTPRWTSAERTVILPKIAVVRADATHVTTRGVTKQGGVTFYAGQPDRYGMVRDRKADRVTIVDGTFGEADPPNDYHVAVVPTVPPLFRPPHSLRNYHVLFEAEWERDVPIDPALLKHLGGDLYAVLAMWDLTELETAVLRARL